MARWPARLAALALMTTLSCSESTAPPRPASLELDVSTALSMHAGARDTLVAIVRDGSGRPLSGVPVTWSTTNASVVQVDDGVLIADSSGTARVIATADTFQTFVDVTVVQSFAALEVEPADTTVRLYRTIRVQLRALDGAGRELPLPPGIPEYATTDSTVLAVNDSGDVRTIGWGSADVIVTLNGISGTATVTGEPTEQAMGGVQLVRISVGSFGHACGLDAAGAAYCWGASGVGETGYFSSEPLPVQAVPTALRFVDIGAGQQMTCGLTAVQEIWCWGTNADGALGQGPGSTVTKSEVPLLVSGGHQWIALGVGKHRGVCAIDVDHVVHCWGHNDLGQLGRGPHAHSDPAVAPVTGDFAATQVDVGIASGCALSTAGNSICWGHQWPGDLPALIAGGPELTQVTVSQIFACGLSLQGEAYCWGRGSSHTLGRDLGVDDLVVFQDPASISGDLRFTKLTATDFDRTCGITTSGRIHCWGQGLPWPGFPQTSPIALGGSEHTFLDIDAGVGFCGLTSTGRVFCW